LVVVGLLIFKRRFLQRIPASIGGAVSHGCIRLANLDVVRLAIKIKAGDNVSIH